MQLTIYFFPQTVWPHWGVLTVTVKGPVFDWGGHRGVRHFSSKFPHKMALVGLGSGIFPLNFHTKWLFWHVHVPLGCAGSYVCSPMCFHMCAFICVLSYVCSSCAIRYVLSYMCSHMCALLSALICVLSSLVSYVCSPVCALMMLCPCPNSSQDTVWGLLPG